MKNNIYKWSSQDGSKEFGELSSIFIGETILTTQSYNLETPEFSGLKARKKSSDLDYWQKQDKKADYKNITRNELGALTAGQGVKTKSTLKLSKSEVSSNSAKVELEVKAGAELSEWLSAEISGSFSMEVSSSFKTDYANKVEASLELPSPAKTTTTYYKSISALPIWYVPDSSAKLSSYKDKPFWAPTDCAQSESVPWCITWKAFNLVTATNNPTAQTNDLDGDMKSDLALFSSGYSKMNIISLNGKKNVNAQVDLSSMGLTPLGVTAYDGFNNDGVWFYSSLINKMVVGFYNGESWLSFIPIDNSTLSETQTLLDIANFDDDSLPELLVGDSATGKLSLWQLTCGENAMSITEVTPLDIAWEPSWCLTHTVDLNGDGVNDILFNDKTSGVLRSYIMRDSQVARNDQITIESGCSFLACGDFNGDRISDLLFSDAKGLLKVSLVHDGVPANSQYIASAPRLRGLELLACGDYDGDGRSDIVLRKTGGTDAVRLMYCFIKPSEKTAGAVEVHKKTNVTLKNVNGADLQSAF